MLQTGSFSAAALSAAGIIFVFAAAALYRAFDALRWRERRVAVIAIIVALPLLPMSAGAATFGLRRQEMAIYGIAYPNPDWVCLDLGRASASICYRDVLSRR